MQRLPLALAALALGSCVIVVRPDSFHRGRIHGSGHRVEEQRDVPEFRQVDFRGTGTVTVHVGEPTALVLSGDHDLLAGVECEVHDGTLVVDVPDHYAFEAELEVVLRTPSLEGFRLGGVADGILHGVEGEALALEVSGASDLRAAGAVERLQVTLSGSCDAALEDLAAQEADVEISGSGSVALAVARRLAYRISGSGDIAYRGDPEVSGRIDGSGHVHRD